MISAELGPCFRLPTGAGISTQRAEINRLTDGSASPLRARIADGYGDAGFQATGLIFPTAGWLEVTGRVGDASLTFVVLVIKEGRK